MEDREVEMPARQKTLIRQKDHWVMRDLWQGV